MSNGIALPYDVDRSARVVGCSPAAHTNGNSQSRTSPAERVMQVLCEIVACADGTAANAADGDEVRPSARAAFRASQPRALEHSQWAIERPAQESTPSAHAPGSVARSHVQAEAEVPTRAHTSRPNSAAMPSPTVLSCVRSACAAPVRPAPPQKLCVSAQVSLVLRVSVALRSDCSRLVRRCTHWVVRAGKGPLRQCSTCR